MTQRKNTIGPTESELQRIEEELRNRNWTPEKLLGQANIKVIFGSNIFTGPTITIKELDDKLNAEDSLIFIEKGRQDDYDLFIKPARSSIQPRSRKERITLDQLRDDLIGQGIIVYNGLSIRTLKGFMKGERINEHAFIALWETLGFDRKEIQALSGKTTRKQDTSHKLYNALVTFDHQPQTDILYPVTARQRRVGAFLIQGKCQYSRIWIMRRLESYIIRDSVDTKNVKKVCFDFSDISHNYNFNIPDIYQKIGADLNGMIKNVLEKKDVIIIFKSIDNFNKDLLLKLLNQFWAEFTQPISRSEKCLLMFLEDCGQNNDWRNDSNILQQVFCVPQVTSFPKEHLKAGLKNVMQELQCLTDDLTPEAVDRLIDQEATKLLQETDGQPRLVLQKIYERFDCKLDKETRWTHYQ